MALNLPTKMAEAKEQASVFLIELYVFYLSTGELRVAACDERITYDGHEYMPVPIKRDKLTQTTDLKTDACKLTIENCDDRFTAAIFSGQDFRGKKCLIFQIMYPESLSDPTVVKPVFYGYLDSPSLISKDATFEVEVKSQIPNTENYRSFQLSCNAVFADQDSCFASKDIQTGTVQNGTTATTIVIEQSRDDSYWNHGIITCGAESRMIVYSTGNTVTVRYPFSSIPTGAYAVERGCDKSYPNCVIHRQQANYSGFPGVPYVQVVREV